MELVILYVMISHLDCNYDDGDYCGSNVNSQFCTEFQCLEYDDINNNPDCTYDGGDCCGSNVHAEYGRTERAFFGKFTK